MLSRLSLFVALALWLFCARAQAQAARDDFWLRSSPNLTGDWFGARSSLAAQGVAVYADSTNFYFGNTAGGLTRDFDFAGHNDYILNLDAQKLGGPEGFFVKLKAEHRYGETLVNDVGAFFSPTIAAELPISNSERVYLTNVLFTQMLSESFAVFAGKLDTLDGDMNAFAHGRGKTQFSNLAFVFNPIAAATVPYSTLGTGFIVLREGQPVASLAVLNSVDNSGTSGFEDLFNDGVLLSAYVRVPTHFFDLPGHHLLGGTWNNRTYLSIGDAYVQYPNLVIPPTRGSWSIYWNFDQYLVVDPDDPTRGWGLFGRWGIADQNTNPLGWFLSFGVGGNSPIAARPFDTFGAGWYYGSTSNQIGPVLQSVFGQIGNGQGVELFYNFQITPAFRLTPDLQVMIPAREAIDPALIVGARAQLIF